MSVFTRLQRRSFASLDWTLVGAMILLCFSGLIILYSAGYDPDLGGSSTMKRQAISMGLGLASFIICLLIHPNTLKRISPVLWCVGLILLVALLFKGVTAGGARRWLDLGSFRMQPSEFMKLGMILVLAKLFSSTWRPQGGYTFVTLLIPLAILFIPAILIIREPDLGTGMTHVMIGLSMLVVAGIRSRTLVRLGIVAALLPIPAFFMLKDYQKNRIYNFVSPENDPLGTGYHALQSMIAVGSGCVSGKGFLQGTQTQLRFLPEQTTDFIFSVLAEEWGFFGSAAVVILYLILVIRALRCSAKTQDPFSSYVCVGVAALLFWQTFVNIGMVIGIVPVVGITLPLLSYGGSSVLTVMSGLGLVAGASLRRV